MRRTSHSQRMRSCKPSTSSLKLRLSKGLRVQTSCNKRKFHVLAELPHILRMSRRLMFLCQVSSFDCYAIPNCFPESWRSWRRGRDWKWEKVLGNRREVKDGSVTWPHLIMYSALDPWLTLAVRKKTSNGLCHFLPPSSVSNSLHWASLLQTGYRHVILLEKSRFRPALPFPTSSPHCQGWERKSHPSRTLKMFCWHIELCNVWYSTKLTRLKPARSFGVACLALRLKLRHSLTNGYKDLNKYNFFVAIPNSLIRPKIKSLRASDALTRSRLKNKPARGFS